MSLYDEIKNFTQEYTKLCVLTLGTAIIAYSIGNLLGRGVSWIRSCSGTTKKVNTVWTNVLNNSDKELASETQQEKACELRTKNERVKSNILGFELKNMDLNDDEKLKLILFVLDLEENGETAEKLESKREMLNELSSSENFEYDSLGEFEKKVLSNISKIGNFESGWLISREEMNKKIIRDYFGAPNFVLINDPQVKGNIDCIYESSIFKGLAEKANRVKNNAIKMKDDHQEQMMEEYETLESKLRNELNSLSGKIQDCENNASKCTTLMEVSEKENKISSLINDIETLKKEYNKELSSLKKKSDEKMIKINSKSTCIIFSDFKYNIDFEKKDFIKKLDDEIKVGKSISFKKIKGKIEADLRKKELEKKEQHWESEKYKLFERLDELNDFFKCENDDSSIADFHFNKRMNHPVRSELDFCESCAKEMKKTISATSIGDNMDQLKAGDFIVFTKPKDRRTENLFGPQQRSILQDYIGVVKEKNDGSTTVVYRRLENDETYSEFFENKFDDKLKNGRHNYKTGINNCIKISPPSNFTPPSNIKRAR